MPLAASDQGLGRAPATTSTGPAAARAVSRLTNSSELMGATLSRASSLLPPAVRRTRGVSRGEHRGASLRGSRGIAAGFGLGAAGTPAARGRAHAANLFDR